MMNPCRVALLFFVCFVLLCVSNVRSESIVALTPENFEEYVGGSKPALVEFYAPWCGHCKQLAPEYERVGKAYERFSKVVAIAKVDCDAHGELCEKHDVAGYPTLKWFPAHSAATEDFDGERNAEGIIEYINQKTGLQVPTSAPSGSSKVVVLTEQNFDEIVFDKKKDIFVEFYAPWCGHCKQLAPHWETLASIFASETDVVIAKVDCDDQTALQNRYEIQGFPTLKFFSKEDKTPQDYDGDRSLPELIEYVNKQSSKNRMENGRLNQLAGRIEKFDELVFDFFSKENQQSIIDQIKHLAEESNEKSAQLYVKMLERALKSGKSFVENEIVRLHKMLDSSSLTDQKKDEFSIRANILHGFLEK